MREFSDKSRFTVRSLPEIFSEVGMSVLRLKGRRPGVEGRMSREVVVNSLFCYFTSLPLEEQLAVFDRGMERLTPLLEAADPMDPAPSAPPPQVDVDVINVEKPAPPSKAKRRG